MSARKPITARAVPAAYELTCRAQDCGETLCGPSGSLFWTTEEIELARDREASIECLACGRANRLPAVRRC